MQAAVPPLSKLVISALISSPELESELVNDLEREFGQVDLVSERMAFECTRYYEPEMGADIHRRMVSFKGLVPPGGLIDVKCRAQALEDRFRDSSRRRKCNLDPGLLSLHNFVLATHKGYTHRIYLGKGIYADLTLIYQRGSFRPLEWTYPDYASAPMIELLNLIRNAYLWQRRTPMGVAGHVL